MLIRDNAQYERELAEEHSDPRLQKIEVLTEALHLALAVIENYEMDIRDPGPAGIEINLVEAGFCQGRIYLGAVNRIRKIANWQPRVP